ncbi:hypothetical protein CBL_02903 [Carabus blaptoides fortunei]
MELIQHEIRKGSSKKPELKEFIRQCLQNAQNLHESVVVMIMDNAPCHSTIEEVFPEADFGHHHLLRLSLYSPMLNPIELAWFDLKSGVKSDSAIQMPHIIANENMANITQTEYRLQSLENIIEENINKLTVVKCTKYIAHIQSFVPDVLNMVDISF